MSLIIGENQITRRELTNLQFIQGLHVGEKKDYPILDIPDSKEGVSLYDLKYNSANWENLITIVTDVEGVTFSTEFELKTALAILIVKYNLYDNRPIHDFLVEVFQGNDKNELACFSFINQMLDIAELNMEALRVLEEKVDADPKLQKEFKVDGNLLKKKESVYGVCNTVAFQSAF